jgi:hypothetical protein
MATQNVVTTAKPYQADYLDFGFDQAKQFYNQGAPGYFPGQTVAGFNQGQIDALNALQGFTPGSAANMSNLGNQFMGGAGTAMNTATNIANGAAPQANMMTMDQLNQYQPMINQMVDASTRQGMRTYNEQFAPQLNAAAAGSGNLGSSRAGIAQGVAQRGIAENAQNVGANAMNNLFNQGNSMNMANANLQLNSNAQQLNAANMLGGMAQTGAGLQAQADGLREAGLQTNLNAGTAFQDMDQANINADMDKFNYEQNADMNWLANYINMVNGNYGTTQTQTQNTKDPSLGRQLLSVGTNLAGAYLMGQGGNSNVSLNPMTWFR